MSAIWCDFLERDFLKDEFVSLVERGIVKGVTSNPSIFANVLRSSSYSDDISAFKDNISVRSFVLFSGLASHDFMMNPLCMDVLKGIYEEIVTKDVRMACDLLYRQYCADPRDGLVSLEIDPFYCDEIELSVAEGVRLWNKIDRPNAMIKVPATESGFTVMKELMSMGINVNATLVFSEHQARKCYESFLYAGSSNVQGVISVFVSRFDREIDPMLNSAIRGRYGIYNAVSIYNRFSSYCKNSNLRILFASTGVKVINDLYNDEAYYVKPLYFADCVNTIPIDTLRVIDLDSLCRADQDSGFNICSCLRSEGFLIDKVQDKLLLDGLAVFKNSFLSMLSFLYHELKS